MRRLSQNIAVGAIAAGLVVISVIYLPPLLRGDDLRRASSGKLVVHEWGTFTSFAGSDGVNLEFRPLAVNDLPLFVLGPTKQPSKFSKPSMYAVQRMETPVIYFYTDVPQIVNVGVDFPKGMLTEWYPVVKSFHAGQPTADRPTGGAFSDWGLVRLTPAAEFDKIRVRGPEGAILPKLPPVAENDHYGRARETDAAIVETRDVFNMSNFEKFLFYRGLGNFELPLKLVALGGDRFLVANGADEASGTLLLVRIENERVRFTRLDPVNAHADVKVTLPSTESTVDALADAMVRELVAAGLYEKESLAMVNTWRTSWFGEEGTRMLYLVPPKQTDELLPLDIDPKPDELVRVLVGRLETLTPEDCQRLVRTLAGGDGADPPAAEAVQAELARLGRFAEPAVQFAARQTKDETSRVRLERILAVLRWGC